MNRKILTIGIGLLLAAMTVPLADAYANHGRPGFGKRGGMDQMLFGKAYFILKNSAELGLSDEKAQAIQALKLETEKALIKQNAEIKVVCLDIAAQLHADSTDVKAVNALIDQKYELKKAKAKGLVEADAKLKGLLTKEQSEKLRALCKAGREKGPAMKECPMPREKR